MKKCLCCGTESVAEAHTCANCGEGSWSVPSIEPATIADEKLAEPIVSSDSETEVESVERAKTIPPPIDRSFDSSDLETAIEVPAKRRRNNR